MKTENLTVIETKGNPTERAEQFGEAFRDNYKALIEVYGHSLSLLKNPKTKKLTDKIHARYLKEIREIPGHMSAIAKGLDVSVDFLLDFNICAMLSKIIPVECSGFIISRDGQTVIGQNLDTTESGCAMTTLEIGRDADESDTARMVAVFPQDASAGITVHGLGMAGCSGPNNIDLIGDADGVTGTLVGEFIYCGCKTANDIVLLAERMPVLGRGFNAVYVDPDGRTLWMQHGGGKSGAVFPKTPYCTATGYRTLLKQPETEKAKASRNRWERLMALGSEAMKKRGNLVDDVKAVMADHYMPDNHPISSPCRHNGPDGSATQYSCIFDLTNMTVSYCGQPCCNPWKTIKLS